VKLLYDSYSTRLAYSTLTVATVRRLNDKKTSYHRETAQLMPGIMNMFLN